MPKIRKITYAYASGRRKSASARVRLFKGKGVSTINSQEIEKYFPGSISKDTLLKPLKLIDATEQYYFTIRVMGGGKRGQLEAGAHALAKALVKEKTEYKKPLKGAGLLTRDSRVRERRKVDTGGKARRKKQSPKR